MEIDIQTQTELEKLKTDLIEIEKILSDYEKQYGITTADFFLKWSTGQTSDLMDYTEWASLAQMTASFHKHIAELESKPGKK